MKDSRSNKRFIREKDFHDRTFEANLRNDADKYYSITRKSRIYYADLLKSKAPKARGLEYGCGQGGSTLLLAKNGANSIGIDISGVGIKQAADKAKNLSLENATSFLIMNAESLQFRDSIFDIVCGTAILHHLNLKKSYSELARVLKSGGLGVFIEPLGHNPIINLYRKLTPKLRTVDEHPFTIKDIKFAKKYFRTVRVKYYHLISLMAVPMRNIAGFRSILWFFEHIDELIFKSLPFVRRYAWTIVIEFSDPIKD